MFKKLLLVSGVFAFAFAILSVSILSSSSISYTSSSPMPESNLLGEEVPEVNYQMPYEGDVLPDSPLWIFKAARDRLWYMITSSPTKKAELALLFSDKRLVSARTLLERKKPDIAISTLTKGEKYLEIAVAQEALARAQGMDTSDFLTKLANSSLKHRQILEGLIPLVPEDGKPFLVKAENYAIDAYKKASEGLNARGLPVPINPFDGD